MKKQILALLLSVFVLASCEKNEVEEMAIGTAKKNAENMVVLHSAKIVTEGLTYTVQGFVKVYNAGYNKEVVVWYQDGQEWTGVNASYYKSVENNYEIWKFTTPVTTWNRYHLPNFTFALKSIVNGLEYWDNNNGNNYNMNINLGSSYVDFLLGHETNVLAQTLSITPKGDGVNTIVDFKGHVQDLDYAKQVLVVFTLDNWVTQQSVEASYLNGDDMIQDGLEVWSVRSTIPVNSEGKDIQAYIKYSVNGQDYFDNNFMNNYNF